MPEGGGESLSSPGNRPKAGAPRVPLDLEALSPEEAAVALKRHNPRITESTEMLAETIRRVRAGVEPLDEDVVTVLRQLLEPEE